MTGRAKPLTSRRLIGSIGTALLALTVASACSSGGGNSSPPSSGGGDSIVLGVLEDSSGPAAPYSQIAMSAVQAAVDDLNASGGLLGKQIKVVAQSDNSDITLTNAAVQKLLGADAAGLILISSPDSAVQAKKAIQAAKVVSIAPVNQNPAIVTQPDADYTFLVSNVAGDYATVAANALKSQGETKLAIFSDASADIQGLVTGFYLPAFAKAGIDVVAQQSAPPDAQDITPQVEKLKSSGAQAAYTITSGGALDALYYRTVKQVGMTIPQYAGAEIGNQPSLWKLAAGALDGMVFESNISPDNPNTKALLSKLIAAKVITGSGNQALAQLNSYQAQTWDAVMLWAKAVTAAKSTDGPKVKAAMESFNGANAYPASFGQTGYTLAYTADNHFGATSLCAMVLREFSNGVPGDAWDKYQPTCSGSN
jgi:branched-chain amino acid transport system substrate-binding protein